MNKELLVTVGTMFGVTVGTVLVGYGLYLGGKYAYGWWCCKKASQKMKEEYCAPDTEPQTS